MAIREFVYTDESGTDDNSQYCAIAGFQGSPGQFAELRREWRAILRKHRVTEFHGNVFFNRKRIKDAKKNPYLKWPDGKADRFLGELTQVVSKRKVRPVGCAVDVKVFNSYSFAERCVLVGYTPKPSRRIHRARPVAYHLAFRHMMSDALSDVHPNVEVHLVCAEHEEYQQRALEGYHLLKKYDLSGLAQQLSSIKFASPKDEALLQVADLFVHLWYKLGSGRIKTSDKAIIAAMNALTRRGNTIAFVNRDGIEMMFAQAGVTPADRARLRRIVGP